MCVHEFNIGERKHLKIIFVQEGELENLLTIWRKCWRPYTMQINKLHVDET